MSDIPSILKKILDTKAREVADRRTHRGLYEVMAAAQETTDYRPLYDLDMPVPQKICAVRPRSRLDRP